jgi:predicted MarR family transcription regulator
MEGEEGEPNYNWLPLVPLQLHPAKVALLEAMAWMDTPLSPSDLAKLLDHKDYYLAMIAYHVRKLAKAGVLEVTDERQVRGATEKFYFFPRR